MKQKAMQDPSAIDDGLQESWGSSHPGPSSVVFSLSGAVGQGNRIRHPG
jgi:hypothetical protein